MPILLKRIYDDPSPDDGYRVLVDRLWPRGISKERARLDEWMKEIAPSHELRKRFHHRAELWEEFRTAYLEQLAEHRDALRPLAERAKTQRVTLLFGARDQAQNQAVVLKQFLETKMAGMSSTQNGAGP